MEFFVYLIIEENEHVQVQETRARVAKSSGSFCFNAQINYPESLI